MFHPSWGFLPDDPLAALPDDPLAALPAALPAATHVGLAGGSRRA
jgi:hypothetical protein